MSIAGGVENAPARAALVHCTAMQIFVKNNKSWQAPPISEDQATRFKQELTKTGINPKNVFAHASYLINLASAKPEVVEKSQITLEDELNRCQQLEIPGLVMHPGAHIGAGREKGLEQITQYCKEVFKRTPDVQTRLLFETTAGTGTNLGATFEDLADLLAMIDEPERTGVCLDTCHIFAAGYEISDKASYTKTMSEFDKVVGLDRLKAIHLNDSMAPFNSRKDRHAHIGQGEIGEEAFRFVMTDPRLQSIPMSLETPKDSEMTEDKMNLRKLYELAGEDYPQ
jgi:deoxyribonuclease IV